MIRFRPSKCRFESVEKRLLLTNAVLPIVAIDVETTELFEHSPGVSVIAGEYADFNDDGKTDFVVSRDDRESN